jgi:hypothetical protein
VSEDSQIVVPPSFIALFVPPGRIKPTASRQTIAARYDLCEDLAQMLTETARAKQFELGVDEATVLERMLRGLLEQGATSMDATKDGATDGATDASEPPGIVTAAEAQWVVRRLAELLDWPPLENPAP